MKWQEEHGVTELILGGIIAGVIFVSLMTLAVIQDLSTKRAPSFGGGSSGPTKTFIGPQVGGAFEDCALTAEKEAGIKWAGSDLGYRKAGGDDEPDLLHIMATTPTEREARSNYNSALDAWIAEMNGLVAKAKASYEKCKVEPPRQPPSTSDPKLEIPGIYNLSLRNPACPGYENSLPKTMSVALSGQHAYVTFAGHHEATGPWSGFDVHVDSPDEHFSADMRFVGESGKTIAEGTYKIDVGGGCFLSFQGRK